MRRRIARKLVADRLAAGPAVVLVGPRQCGKTVLARSFSRACFDLEQPEDRARLDVEWPDLVRGRKLVVLDEAQSMPSVFPRIRGAIDADRRRCGRFLLLGSVSPALMREVSESLAGRLAVVELAPFAAGEVPGDSLRELWLCGGYPDGGILRRGAFPAWQRDYLSLLAERDLPAWGLPSRPQMTTRLMAMLAASHGHEWNASRIGQGLGLSYHTVNTYLDWLEGAFLVRRVPPWLPNLRKRLVRSPRVYWRDSGILHALLGVASRDELLTRPWVGASWEGFVLQQIAATLAALGRAPQIHWFRTSDGSSEIDFVFEHAGETWAVECKLTTAPSDEDLAKLDRAADLIRADRRVIVAPVERSAYRAGRGIVSVPELLRLLGA
ncbi:MAG: hypothetical protein HMLKMBBP_00907 [Planctomycetes bacterium]|nr:hypothetical protein [Planctomycetota bacterium]